MSFFDIEANFHGDKHTLYDPDVKFSTLGEPFWRLDFKPSSLLHWRPYRDNIKFLVSLGGEVAIVGGLGMLYIYLLSILLPLPSSFNCIFVTKFDSFQIWVIIHTVHEK